MGSKPQAPDEELTRNQPEQSSNREAGYWHKANKGVQLDKLG